MSGSSELPKCALCGETIDPRLHLETADCEFYALCEGCAPSGIRTIAEVAAACRESGTKPLDYVPRFGFSELVEER